MSATDYDIHVNDVRLPGENFTHKQQLYCVHYLTDARYSRYVAARKAGYAKSAIPMTVIRMMEPGHKVARFIELWLETRIPPRQALVYELVKMAMAQPGDDYFDKRAKRSAIKDIIEITEKHQGSNEAPIKQDEIKTLLGWDEDPKPAEANADVKEEIYAQFAR